MPSKKLDPVLIIGGSGFVGSIAARTLRKMQPDLPITIGGRDMAKAQAIADEIGNADTAGVDLDRAGLGLPADRRFSAIAIFLKDDTLNSVRYAQDAGIGILGVATAAFEVGPEVVTHISRPQSAPILMDSAWLAGTATLPILTFARDFESIESIEIGALLDDLDMGGPAAEADYVRQTSAGPNALVLKDGAWCWIGGDDAKRNFTGVDGTVVEAAPYCTQDALCLSASTDARSIRFDLAVGETATRRRGEHFSTEIIVEIEGKRKDGSQGRNRYEIVHPLGQAPMTAVGVSVGIERLIGLTGEGPAQPGLHFPSSLINPDYMVARLREFGTLIERV